MYFNHAFRKSFLPTTSAATTITTSSSLTTTIGTQLLTASTTGVTAGMAVSGTGIAPGTTVVSLVSNTSVTLSLPIIDTVPASTTITIGPTSIVTTAVDRVAPNKIIASATISGVSVGQVVTGTNIPSGTTVTAVSGTTLTLSKNVTGTVSTGATITIGKSVAMVTSGSTASLTAGQIGFFSSNGSAAQSASSSPFMIAQGSWFTNDKIGPFHGGYTESVKSKIINPKYVTRLIKVAGVEAQNQIIEVCTSNTECGKTYRLRLDLKGSPALRFLSHNIYRTLDAFTGCCTDDCSATCTGALVDPTTVLIKWAKQIVENPILSKFLKVEVKNFESGDDQVIITQAGTSDAQIATFISDLDDYAPTNAWDPTASEASTTEACMLLEVAYVETKFGNCTFTPTDFYELMPLKILASMTDETGDPCNVQGINIDHDFQVPIQAQGVGETVLRELILDGRYRQEAYPDSSRVESLRMREIEANPGLATINRATGIYDRLMILHSVPRFNNPTGTFDNDQYLLVFHVETGTDVSAIVNYIQDSCAAVNNPVTLETY